MLIRKKRGWETPESAATPEHVFHGRRALIKAAAAGSILAAASPFLGAPAAAADSDPTADLYPAKRNDRYVLDRPVTAEKEVTTYNNFYEFGSQKTISSTAQALKIRPWTVTIDGMVDKPVTIEIGRAHV